MKTARMHRFLNVSKFRKGALHLKPHFDMLHNNCLHIQIKLQKSKVQVRDEFFI